MKQKFKYLLALLAASVLFSAAVVPTFASEETLPTLDEIVASHIEGVGGEDVINSIESLRLTGKLALPQGMEADLLLQQKKPAKIRMEFTIQGMTGIQSYDGTAGWTFMPFQGQTEPEPMPEESLDEMKEQAEMEPVLYKWKDKGYQVELVGKEEVEGADTYKVKVVREDGREEFHYLDTEYFLTLKTTGERELMGNKVQFEVTFSDFKEVGGMMMPHSIAQSAVGMPMQTTIRIDKVEVNPEISDDIFVMPAAEPAEAEE